MLDYINALLGFNVLEVFGNYYGYMVIVLFSVVAVDFFIQVFMTFWRWLLHDK